MPDGLLGGSLWFTANSLLKVGTIPKSPARLIMFRGEAVPRRPSIRDDLAHKRIQSG
jgi:hypothetical protein